MISPPIDFCWKFSELDPKSLFYRLSLDEDNPLLLIYVASMPPDSHTTPDNIHRADRDGNRLMRGHTPGEAVCSVLSIDWRHRAPSLARVLTRVSASPASQPRPADADWLSQARALSREERLTQNSDRDIVTSDRAGTTGGTMFSKLFLGDQKTNILHFDLKFAQGSI